MLAALDYLHAYYQLNHTALLAEYTAREATNTARERSINAHPLKQKDNLLHFWKIEETR